MWKVKRRNTSRCTVPCCLLGAESLSDAPPMQFGSSWLHKTLLSLTEGPENNKIQYRTKVSPDFLIHWSSPFKCHQTEHISTNNLFSSLCFSLRLWMVSSAFTCGFSALSFSPLCAPTPSMATMRCFTFSWRAAHKLGCLPAPPTFEDISWSECKFAPGEDFAGVWFELLHPTLLV